LHNETFRNFYFSPNIIGIGSGHVASIAAMKYFYILVRNSEAQVTLLRPRHRCENTRNFRCILRKYECGYMNRIQLNQDGVRWRILVDAVINL
jgi:hypothetical protein